jgi:predicted PurR-regulated permease PerM
LAAGKRGLLGLMSPPRAAMSRTVNVNPLLVLVSILIGSSIGDWFGGYFGAFVAALLSIPCAAALQVIVRELWRATAPGGPLG